MAKYISLHFISRIIYGVVLIGSASLSVQATERCDQIFMTTPLSVHIRNTTPTKEIVYDDVWDNESLIENFYQLDLALAGVLQHTNKQTNKQARLSSRILEDIPKSTEEIQLLGYNLMHEVVQSVHLEAPADGSVYVSLKPLSMQEIIDKVTSQTDASKLTKKTRKKIETLIELVAASVGSPSERLILTSSISERNGSAAEKLGPGKQVQSIVIINTSTGLMIEMNFVETPITDSDDGFRGGPGWIG